MNLAPLARALKRPDLLRSAGFIDGTWVAEADGGRRFDVVDPARDAVIATLPDMGAAEAARAIAAAEASRHDWAALAAKDRARVLRRWFDLMTANADDLAIILSSEMGKPLPEARGEIAYASSYIEWFAEEAKRVYGSTIPGHQHDKRITVIRQPVGVVGTITPWNFPSAMIARKVAPALAVGCAVVSKPSELTPLSALAMAALAEEAGLPAGLFNVVVGTSGAEIGGEMTSNPAVRKISFTGSTQVGRLLLRQGADQIKKMSMELGGNAPFIVFDDADIDAAVDGAIAAKFRNAGQTCVCANRIFVQAGVHDAFTRKLAERVRSLRIGDPFAEGTDIGPLVNRAAVDKVRRHIDDATGKGARILAGGEVSGLFVQPVLIDGATTDMAVSREETFGPLAAIFTFGTEDDVVALANASEYGLAAYFYAKDVARVTRVAERLEAGMVGINTGLISTEAAPFGGVKQSGLGREGSSYGIDDYVELKYLCLGL